MKTKLERQMPYQSVVQAAKNYLARFWAFNLLFIVLSVAAAAQVPGSLKITITDAKTKEAIPFANVIIFKDKIQVATGTSDLDGNIIFKPLDAAKYNVKAVYLGYTSVQVNDVLVLENKTTYLDIKLKDEGVSLDVITVSEYRVPLIDANTTSGGTAFCRQDHVQMANKSINTVVSTQAGVYQHDAGKTIYTRGSRQGGTTYFIDGLRAVGTQNVQQQAVAPTTVITGGIPGQYGSAVSGAVSVQDIKPVAPVEEELKAGVLTAGEINDFKKWNLWKDVSAEELKQYQSIWKIKPAERYMVMALNENRKPLVDANVTLCTASGNILWKARTDNTGKAELWTDLYEEQEKAAYCEVEASGIKVKQSNLKKFHEGVNVIGLNAPCAIADKLDILFMVDATASMDDEINYLKAELNDILASTKSNDKGMKIRTGSLFYKCVGNSYTTRPSAFTSDITTTMDFIKQQSSSEGGVEAVEIALEEAVEKYEWSSDAATRLLFIVLDEPPGNDKLVVEKLHSSIRKAAEKGIRIIPLVASGGTDTYFIQKSMEYLMRSMALATNGTYAFLTDHSGVGGQHSKPSTNEYDVELLNKLILRIIRQFSTTVLCSEDAPAPLTTADTAVVVIAHEIVKVTQKRSERPLPPAEQVKTDSSLVIDSLNSPVNEVANSAISKSFKFYPNPTKGRIFLETHGKVGEIYLSDINGKLMEKFDVKKSGNEIDLGNYAAGEYLLQYPEDGKWKSGKLILLGN